ncbi:MAG: polysaccharide lyase family 7 protein [Candidatus Kapaibacterium sp.]|jgi:hypothetical protein
MNPSDVCDLSHCSLQVPVNNKFTSISNLKDYHDSHFYKENDYIVCRITCGEVTSGGSHYPRTELKGKTSFTSKDRQHLEGDYCIKKAPIKKPVVCFSQVKCTNPNIEIEFLYSNGHLVFRDFDAKHYDMGPYKLGDWFHMRVASFNNEIHVFLNRNPKEVVIRKNVFSNCNWKMGCYTQSNGTIDDPKTESMVLLKNIHIV